MSNVLAPKDPDVSETYTINWREELLGTPERDQYFVLGAVVRPVVATGFYYECTTAGRTARRYPRWPTVEGQTVQDGSAVFTSRHPDTPSLVAVQTAVWTVPSGLTLDSQSESGPETHVTVSGGVDCENYELLCRMTDSAGQVRERTIVVPVRSQ